MYQIHRHTSECDTVPVGEPLTTYEYALAVLKILVRHNREADFEIENTETGRYMSWVIR